MSSEIAQAFDHPDARSRATLLDSPLDRISLRDHIVDVEIGAFQAERGTTQRISFNVVVEVLPTSDDVDDDVDKILSYDKVTEAITIALREERLNLLETLADRVAEHILWEPQAQRTFVRIEKLDRGSGALGVEIVRSKSKQNVVCSEETIVRPTVIFLTNEAIESAHLKGWIDQLEATPTPTLICVGAPQVATPKAQAALAQRRIELLAIEQNAWVLAANETRCVVVETRTELDWAMKNAQVSVWAPSKIVLDAVDGPSSDVNDALDLALWFAQEMEAERFIAVGEIVNPVNSSMKVDLRKVTEVEL